MGVMYMSEKGYTDTNSEYMKVSSLIVHLRSYTGPSLHKGLFSVIYLTSVFRGFFGIIRSKNLSGLQWFMHTCWKDYTG
jgi:hypothetical protein